MSKSGLLRIVGWIAGLLVSYIACFGILDLRMRTFPPMSRLGLICALVCSVGANVFFLGQNFGHCGKEARLVCARLPDVRPPGAHPGNDIVSGWRSAYDNYERAAARRLVDGIVVYQIRLPELPVSWTFRARHSDHDVS
jgi:hypothetical protein